MKAKNTHIKSGRNRGREKIHRVTKWNATLANVSASTSATGTVVYSFKLSDLPDSADIAAMYDQYRITEVEVHWYPTQPGGNPTSVGGAALMLACVDHNDNLASTQAAILSREDTRVFPMWERWTWRFRPQASVAYFQSATATGYGPAPESAWIDTASPSVPYYGFKAVIPIVASASLMSGCFMLRYHVELKYVL